MAMKGLIADLKHALRVYWRTPLSSLIVILVLAIAMAFVGSFLSLYVDLVLRPHPGIEQSGQIVTIGQNDGRRLMGIPLALVEQMADEVSSLEAVAGTMTTSLEIGPERDSHIVELVTRDYFSGIRPKLALGRGFDEADQTADAEPVAVISDDYWREQFDRSPDALGQVIEIAPRPAGRRISMVNGEIRIEEPEEDDQEPTEYRVVGVMAPEMPGLMIPNITLWLPLERAIELTNPPDNFELFRNSTTVQSVGRLARSATAEAVASEVETRYSGIDEFRLRSGFKFDAIDGIVRDINVHRDVTRQLQLFLVGSILLALVAAANVSLFLLARAPGRRRELGIRMSVGAPMKRLARQLASESGLLVLVAAVLGLMLSIWFTNFLRGLAFLRRAEWGNVTLLDWRVLGLVGAFLMLLALAVSLAPILGLRRLGIAASSRQIAANASLAQRIAGTVQIAIAGTLGGAAIAFGWYLGSLMLGYPGYTTDDLYIARFSQRITAANAQSIIASFSLSVVDQGRQREAIESLPSVTGVAFGNPVPGDTSRSTMTISDPLDPTQQFSFRMGSIDDRFIDLLGLRVRYGRAPTEDEVGVAVVNQTAARRYFDRDDVVGESLPITSLPGASTEIVGVLEDVSFDHPAAEVEPMVFMTNSRGSISSRGALVRSPLPAAELQQELQGLIDSGAIEVDTVSLTPLAAMRSNLIAPDRARGFLTIGAASLVVLLAAFGFYGTQRYLVSAGRREYAIRASLGAGPTALGHLVLQRGMLLSLPGLLIGALLAFIVVAWLRDDFVSRDISASGVTAAVVAGLAALLLVASVGPAHRARRTQPAPLLREE